MYKSSDTVSKTPGRWTFTATTSPFDRNFALYTCPNEAAATRAYAERGVLARLGACVADWCEISAQGESGWVLKAQLWGVSPGELRD